MLLLLLLLQKQIYKTVIKNAYEAGGNPDMMLVKPTIKQAISGLSSIGVTTLQTAANKAAPATAVGAVDVYVSDFGNFKIMPNSAYSAGLR